MSQFFINRPIFATVISIIIIIAGLAGLRVLPISQYPEIAPPTVTVTASYPGASAETLAKTVAAPIEEQLNGVENMLYFNSASSSDGSLTITLTFESGTNVDQATINVNNRVQTAIPRLPDVVRQTGVTVAKRSNDLLLVASIRSTDSKYDSLYLSNYTSINILDPIKRIPGVGEARVLGARDYGMRIWLKTDRMAQLGVTTADIAQAIRSQNQQFAAGKIGQEPSLPGQNLVFTVTAQGRLIEPEEFGNIVLRANGAQGVLRIKDVARVELDAQNYDIQTQLNGKPNNSIGVFLQSGANALETASKIRATFEELSTKFPEGVVWEIPFDTTRVVKESIKEVIITLLEAALLVVAVVFVFLQNWRATLIPIIAVPVSLIGTFAGLYVLGLSINTLTLFALVLAIGIVVDDAIVVLENVERIMHVEGLSPKESAIKAMKEVSAAVVAIVLVLCAVFIPVAFLGGLAGKLYQQFAITISIAVVISGVVALTLTPALCALLLKPSDKTMPMFAPFNRMFEKLTHTYTSSVNWAIKRSALSAIIFGSVIVVAVVMIRSVPTSFVPVEDQGYLISAGILPDGASLPRTMAFTSKIQTQFNADPAVEHVFVLNGLDFIGGGNKTNVATMFMPLKPWDERSSDAPTLAKTFMKNAAMSFREGNVLVVNPPAIRGLGSSGGFELYLQSKTDSSPAALYAAIQSLTSALQSKPELTGINSFFRPTVPQLKVVVDREKSIALGVPVSDVFDALQATMGNLYVNDFNKFGRTYRVQIQADKEYRAKPEDLGRIYVRSQTGNMIPVSALMSVKSVVGPELLERFNGFLAAKVIGGAAPGISSGQALQIVEQTAKDVLPPGYEIAFTGQAFQEKRVSSSSALAFVFALVMVFLILAAQFEKWSLPMAVLLAVPFAVLGALVAVWLRDMSNDIYFQIGLVTLIGLAAKNAILIVEFASQKMDEGMDVTEAALAAARLRFRPIVMTSLAFVLGVLPLAVASGAGAGARKSMGTGVLGGMLAATFIATIFVPLFFKWLSKNKRTALKTAQGEEA